MTDQKSVKQISQGKFIDRGSKFYSFLHPITDLETYKILIKRYKEENPNACHVCSAYRIYLNGWVDEYATDDGEPNGSAGLPMLNVLKRNNLVNIGIYVVRIYGGVNLGISGLINAYSISAQNSIKDACLINWKQISGLVIEYSYDLDRIIKSVIKSFKAVLVDQEFKDKIISKIEIDKDKASSFIDLLNDKTSGKILFHK
tara:strand:- start:48 stop:650 length:603 start_codon:yes stop_codon:yes gene_type:complete